MLVPDAGPVRRFCVSRRLLRGCVFFIFGTVVFGTWGLYSAYQTKLLALSLQQTQRAMRHAQTRYDNKVAGLQEKLAAEQQKQAVYARTLGQMRARLSRLDTLGAKLVEVAALDKSEFDFGLAPAFGGPRQTQPALVGLDAGLHDGMRYLSGRMQRLDSRLAAIDYMLESERSEKNARPHAWPSEGGWLSSRFGLRSDPFTGKAARHYGVDIANRFGAPIVAASRGIVTFAGKMKDFGYMVDIDHGYGYKTRYGHMSMLDVQVGDIVNDNQLLGRIGSTGHSTGPHLHYEVHRYGKQLNPVGFLPRG